MTYHFPAMTLLASALANLASAAGSPKQDPVDFVNPYIGNISHLLRPTYPTVSLPNGMLRMVPNRGSFTSNFLHGLPLTVHAHSGGSAFNFSPYVGDATLQGQGNFSFDNEHLTPYRYSVTLDDQDIKVEFSTSRQAAIYRLSFPKGGDRSVVFHVNDGSLHWADGMLTGSQSLGNKTKLYVALLPDIAPTKTGALEGQKLRGEANDAKTLVLRFDQSVPSVALRYGVSFISIDQARRNLQREAPDFNLDRLATAGRAAWNQALGKLKVEGDDENQKTVFYTALYRTYERMVNISEDGQYWSAYDQQVHQDDGVGFYVDDWIWDTFRAAHPLHALINPHEESAKIASYIRMAEQSKEGWIPTFPQVEGDSHVMNGNHFVSALWDSYSNGLRGFDLAKGYEGCKKAITESSMAPWMRRPAGELDAFYREHGFWPALHPGEKETVDGVHGFEKRQAVAVTLAASFDDWCLAQIAKELGKTEDYEYFHKRSFNYRNLFNSETGFFHPKDSEGKFIEPFDYRFAGGMGARDYYDENNGWTYRWDVQHNIPDLVKLMGGPSKFIENLDRTFDEGLGMARYDFYSHQPDSTGNVGQFVMGNEPSLHIPYLYNYAGAAWKTQKRVRSLLDMWFRNDLMGVPGDEDGGGLSGFVVFSAMGFYPVAPGTGTYTIGSPLFRKVTIEVGGGKQFVVEAKGCSRDNKYIQSARLNGKALDGPWLAHKDLVAGGRLELVMGSQANKNWGANVP